MRSPLFPALLVFLALSTAHAAPAAAQDIAVAEALFDRGLADMKAGKYETGCKALAESQRLDPRPGTLFTLATCEADWGHIATAVSRFRDYLALYNTLSSEKKASQGERPKVAEETRARLSPDVPQLTLSLPKDAPAGTVVERNGEIVAASTLGIALPVDPGEQVLTVKTPSGAAREQRITIVKGEKKQVTSGARPPGPAGAGGARDHHGPVVTPPHHDRRAARAGRRPERSSRSHLRRRRRGRAGAHHRWYPGWPHRRAERHHREALWHRHRLEGRDSL